MNHTHICISCDKKFDIFSEDISLLHKLSPKIHGEVLELDLPQKCPECRQQQRISYRNERNLYLSQCSESGKNIVSLYSPDKKHTVYSSYYWDSDSWNAIDYAQEIIDNKPFFTQWKSLYERVPKKSLYWYANENADFTNDATHCKDCYLLFASDYCIECQYGVMQNSKNSLDCFECWDLQECYECIGSDKLYNVSYSINSENCRDSQYIFNCINCENCFLCDNLISQKYCIRNMQYTPEEYEIKKSEILHPQENLEEYKKLVLGSPTKASTQIRTENCQGNNIRDAKDCFHCFDIVQAKDCRYVFYGSLWCYDCMDTSMVSLNSSLCYNSQSCLENCFKLICCNFCISCLDSYYLDNCRNCKNCFWCVWLRDAQYCIFNKQYSQQDYENHIKNLIMWLKKEWKWWEFFPAKYSPFGYNETVAHEFFPLEEKDALKRWWKYCDYISPDPKVNKIIPADKIPEDIQEIPDDILNWAIKCSVSGRAFRITPQELQFYRKHNIWVPKKHPDIRHIERMELRSPRKLYKRKCDECNKEITSPFHDDVTREVLCDVCYNMKYY